MTTMNSQTGSRSVTYRFVIRALVVAQGVITMFASFFLFPLGAALVIANGVMAIATRGTNRKLLAGFAIAGAVICILLGLLLPAMSYIPQVGGPSVKL